MTCLSTEQAEEACSTDLFCLAILQITLPKLHPKIVLVIDLQHFERCSEPASCAMMLKLLGMASYYTMLKNAVVTE